MIVGKNERIAIDIIKNHSSIAVTELKKLLKQNESHLIQNPSKVIDSLKRKNIIVEENDVIRLEENTQNSESLENFRYEEGFPTTWISVSKDHKFKGYKIPFSPLTLSDEDALKFFVFTVRHYLELIDLTIASDIELKSNIVSPLTLKKLYLSPTDKFLLDPNCSLSVESFIFKEMVFHSQNKQGGIDFFGKETDINRYLLNYDINAFHRYISTRTKGTEVPHIATTLSVSETQAENFFDTVKSVCEYLYGKKRTLSHGVSFKDHVKRDFIGYMATFDYLGIFNRMKNPPISIKGLGEALTFDFLKEFDRDFDLPKPDLHVKRTMVSLMHFDRSPIGRLSRHPTWVDPESISSIKGRDNCMELYLNLVKQINREFAVRARAIVGRVPIIRNYILDKMIYMICSGKMYLNVSNPSSSHIKKFYRRGILTDDYKNITIIQQDLRDILALI